MKTILAILGFILSLFRGGGTRVTLESRSEGSIEAERKRLAKLRSEVKRQKGLLNDVTIKIAKAKAQGHNGYADSLDSVRRLRIKQFNDAKSEYIRQGGRWP